MDGVATSEIAAEVSQKFEDGVLRSSERAGVAYMLSGFNRPFNLQADALGWFPPHVMIFASGVTNNDIGTTNEALRTNSQVPFIAYQGPQGYIISNLDRTASQSDYEIKTCPAWVSAIPSRQQLIL